MLVKASLCFLLLVYIHVVYTRHPVQCLEHVSDTWPRDGILRVEIVRSPPVEYTIEHSYTREKQLAKRHKVGTQCSILPSTICKSRSLTSCQHSSRASSTILTRAKQNRRRRQLVRWRRIMR